MQLQKNDACNSCFIVVILTLICDQRNHKFFYTKWQLINASKIIPAARLINIPPNIVNITIPTIGCLSSHIFNRLYIFCSNALSLSQNFKGQIFSFKEVFLSLLAYKSLLYAKIAPIYFINKRHWFFAVTWLFISIMSGTSP